MYHSYASFSKPYKVVALKKKIKGERETWTRHRSESIDWSFTCLKWASFWDLKMHSSGKCCLSWFVCLSAKKATTYVRLWIRIREMLPLFWLQEEEGKAEPRLRLLKRAYLCHLWLLAQLVKCLQLSASYKELQNNWMCCCCSVASFNISLLIMKVGSLFVCPESSLKH